MFAPSAPHLDDSSTTTPAFPSPSPNRHPQCQYQPHHHRSAWHISTSTPGPTRTPLPLPQPSPLPLPATTPQCHQCPHDVEINEAVVGATPDIEGPNGIGGGGAAGDEGAVNGEGAACGIIGSGVDGGEEEAGGAIKEHDGVAARDIEGEGVVEDDVLGVEADSDARGEVGKGDEVDNTGWRGG